MPPVCQVSPSDCSDILAHLSVLILTVALILFWLCYQQIQQFLRQRQAEKITKEQQNTGPLSLAEQQERLAQSVAVPQVRTNLSPRIRQEIEAILKQKEQEYGV